MMKSNYHQQQGFQFIRTLTIIVILALVVLFLSKIVPPYVTHYLAKQNLRTAIAKVQSQPNQSLMSFKQALSKQFDKQLQVNSIYSISAKNLLITRNQQYYDIQLRYQQRIPLIANIDFLLHFHDQFKTEPK